jgi:hypothetical protein
VQPAVQRAHAIVARQVEFHRHHAHVRSQW